MISKVGRFLPHIVVATALASVILTSAIFSSVSVSSQPKVIWNHNPITIQFTAGGIGSGPLDESFKCSPATTGGVTLRARTSSSNVLLTATPSGFAGCTSSTDFVSITAQCAPGVSMAACRGTYNGSVQVRDNANYRNLPDQLTVSITVT